MADRNCRRLGYVCACDTPECRAGVTGYGMYAHHETLCPEGECRPCDRERARQAPERVHLQQTLDQRARTRARIVERAKRRSNRGRQ